VTFDARADLDPAAATFAALLADVRAGRTQAWQPILEAVYGDLRQLARRALRGRERTLATTAVVHEAWLKLAARPDTPIRDRAHFFALAALLMRQVIVDHARERLARKRGAGLAHVELDLAEQIADRDAQRFIELNEALAALERISPRLAHTVECRFFLGLNDSETAAVLGHSIRSVRRDWATARTHLKASLGE
jgi:RNA polymerase sigma factor (TIGR02999 family)